MGWETVLLLFFGTLILLLLSGVPVSFCFLIVSCMGAFIYWGGFSGIGQMSLKLIATIKQWSLLPIPLFILMGELLFRSGVASRAIDIVDLWMGKVPGRLSIVGVASACLMGTFTGSSMATTSMLASGLVPEMEKRGYHPIMCLGSICGAGGLAMMIPPSSLAVFLATVASVSVGKMLIGGIIPGLLMAAGYITYIVVRAKLQPQYAPTYAVPKIPLKAKLKRTALDVFPLAIIVFSVTGVILLGIATPSEAAACGVVGSLLVTFAYRAMDWQKIKASLIATIKTSAMLFTIMLGSATFSQILSFSGATKALTAWVIGLSVHPIVVVILLLIMVLFMGCFMEVTSIIMITVPIFMPIITALGFDPIWFLLMFLVTCEMAESTPPFGVLLFLLKGLYPKVPMSTIINSAWPFLCADAFAIIVIMIFPAVALWLPSLV